MAISLNDVTYPTPGILKQGCRMLPVNIHTGNVLVNIRGTNGSGKTYTTRKIVDGFPLIQVHKMTDDNITVYEYEKFFLIGSYESDCGGLDTVHDFYKVAPLALELLKSKSVLMEGLLWSSVFSAMHNLEHQAVEAGHAVVWAGFTYTLDVMVERVVERRLRRGQVEPLKVSNMVHKVRPVFKGLNNAIAFGSNVLLGDSDHLQVNIVKILSTKSFHDIPFQRDHFKLHGYEVWEERLKAGGGEHLVGPDPEEAARVTAERQTTNCIFDMC